MNHRQVKVSMIHRKPRVSDGPADLGLQVVLHLVDKCMWNRYLAEGKDIWIGRVRKRKFGPKLLIGGATESPWWFDC